MDEVEQFSGGQPGWSTCPLRRGCGHRACTAEMRWFWRGPNRRLQAAKARLARPSQVLYASVQLKDKTQQAGAEEKKVQTC